MLPVGLETSCCLLSSGCHVFCPLNSTCCLLSLRHCVQCLSCLQDESDVQLYSIAYWEQLEGDMPPPCSSPPPELEESCESRSP